MSAATAVTACQWPLDSDGPDALRSATPGTNFKAKYFHPQGVAAVLDRNSAADPNVGKHIPFFHLLNSAAALLLCFTSGDHSKGGKLDLIDLKKNHELQKWQEKFKTNSRNKREKSRNLPLSSYWPLFCHEFQLEFALAKYLELKMSAQSVHMDSEASSQSSYSGPEGQVLSSLEKTKAKKQPVQSWNFQYILQTDFRRGRHKTSINEPAFRAPPN